MNGIELNRKPANKKLPKEIKKDYQKMLGLRFILALLGTNLLTYQYSKTPVKVREKVREEFIKTDHHKVSLNVLTPISKKQIDSALAVSLFNRDKEKLFHKAYLTNLEPISNRNQFEQSSSQALKKASLLIHSKDLYQVSKFLSDSLYMVPFIEDHQIKQKKHTKKRRQYEVHF